jgi:erythromycin esterase
MKPLPFLASILLVAPLLGQPAAQTPPERDPRVAWLARNATAIRTFDPADGDFRDLEPLRAAFKGSRVVMLGEGSHGEGTTFLAKTRLIRFLHEQMGFNVLAFESGLYDCPKAWEFLVKGEEPRAALSRGIFAIWTKSREVQPLLDYIGREAKGKEAKGAHPLELTGFDCQTTASAAVDFLVPDLAAYLTRLDPKITEGEEWRRVAGIIGQLNHSAWETGEAPMPSAGEQEAFARTIERWQALIKERDPSPATQPWSGPYWRQFLDSLRVFAEQNWRTDYSVYTKMVENTPVPVFNMRDVQMGKNLIWLATERYPKEKIIVWAATGHLTRAMATIQTTDPKLERLYAGWTPMGDVARRKLGDAVYVLGAIAYEGETARYASKTATPLQSSPGSLEDLFVRASFENAFLDLRHTPPSGGWLHALLTAKLLGQTEMQAVWPRVVDGVIFMRKMDRSHKKE